MVSSSASDGNQPRPRPHFLTLPREIREQVYHHVFLGIVVCAGPDPKLRIEAGPNNTWALCHVSHECRAETKPIFLSTVTFHLIARITKVRNISTATDYKRWKCTDRIFPLTLLQTRFGLSSLTMIRHIKFDAAWHWGNPFTDGFLVNVGDIKFRCLNLSSFLPNLTTVEIDTGHSMQFEESIESLIARHSHMPYIMSEDGGGKDDILYHYLFPPRGMLRMPILRYSNADSHWLNSLIMDFLRPGSPANPRYTLRFEIHVYPLRGSSTGDLFLGKVVGVFASEDIHKVLT